MNLLHVHSGNMWGGVETALLALAGVRADGVTQRFALCFDGPLARALAGAGAAVETLGPVRFSRPWTAWRARRRLRQVMSRHRVTAAVCHGPWALTLSGRTVRRAGARLGVWLHGPPDHHHWLDRAAIRRRPEVVIGNSGFTGAAAAAAYGRDDVRVVMPPVAPPPDDERPQSPLPDAGSRQIVLMAARFDPWKGHALLVESLARLAARDDWECWIAGEAQRPEEQAVHAELLALIRVHRLDDRIRLLGFRNDIGALLRRATLLCQPNTGPEPFGLAFAEAMWRGRPVITTALGAAPELVTPQTGRLVPPGDPAALAGALAAALDDPALRAAAATHGPLRARELCEPGAALLRLAEALA